VHVEWQKYQYSIAIRVPSHLARNQTPTKLPNGQKARYESGKHDIRKKVTKHSKEQVAITLAQWAMHASPVSWGNRDTYNNADKIPSAEEQGYLYPTFDIGTQPFQTFV